MSAIAQSDLKAPTDLRDRIAQLVMIRIGSNLPPILRVHEDEQRVAHALEQCPVGGLLLFNGTWPESRETLDRLQSQSEVPLLVASDIERGAGQQVAGLTQFPHQRAFVDLQDADNHLADFAKATTREARATGIHVTFGPVADVNSDPRNPIIATRAFGDEPARVGELVASYVRAMEGTGLLSCAKHFPGHGDTHQDSHDAMPSVGVSKEALLARELVPFQAAIDAGVAMFMTAHVEYPALDPTGAPATLSKPILVDLLRGEMGFEGVVCSDSLLMAGVRGRFDSEGEMAIATLNAGVDLLLDIEDHVAVVDSLTRAVEDNRLSVERVDEAFDRVWRLKQKAFSGTDDGPPTVEQQTEAAEIADRIALAATSVIADSGSLKLPLPADGPLTALLFKPHHRPTDPSEQPLAAALRERFASVRYFETGPDISESLEADLLAGAPADTPILVAMIVKPAAWHAFGLTKDQNALVKRLLKQRPVVLACLGVKEALDDFLEAPLAICTHSDSICSQKALAQKLAL